MTCRFPFVIFAATTMLACTIANADTSIGLNAGTLGGGIELAHAFTERLGIRIGANGLKYDSTESYQSVDYDSKLKLATGELLFDWFPFANNFRISAGAMYNGNKLTLSGKPSPGGPTRSTVSHTLHLPSARWMATLTSPKRRLI